MTQLVKDAVGFDEKRGDSVNVINAAFHVTPTEEEEPMESVPIWERPIVRDIAKLVLGALVLIVLVMQVLRPLVKNLLTPMRAQLGPMGADYPMQQALPGGMQMTPGAVNYEQQIAMRVQRQQDPRRVAQVVKTWVGQEG